MTHLKTTEELAQVLADHDTILLDCDGVSWPSPAGRARLLPLAVDRD